eukprot:1851745-Heterocapsa_arctica.AAC.1
MGDALPTFIGRFNFASGVECRFYVANGCIPDHESWRGKMFHEVCHDLCEVVQPDPTRRVLYGDEIK